MFYLSRADSERHTIQDVYRSNKLGFGAKRIPRKAKKALKKEWLYWRMQRKLEFLDGLFSESFAPMLPGLVEMPFEFPLVKFI